MARNELGSEVVQFVFAVILLLTLMFGTLYIVCYTSSAIMLSSELSRACLRLDAAGLAESPDKARFIAAEIAGESSQLKLGNIDVNDVRVETREKSAASPENSLQQRSKVASVSFSISYRLPVELSLEQVQNAALERRVVCSIENERVSEVSIS